jgi:integrase
MATIRQRTRKDGSTTYHVQVRLMGHGAQTETFRTKSHAKRWAQQTEAAIKEGRYFKTREAQRHTVAEMIDRYIASVGDDKKDAKNQAQQLRKWKDRIGEYVLADVTPALVLEHRDRLGSEPTERGIVRGPATVNRMLAALSVAFTAAWKEWQWTDTNPVLQVKKRKEPRGRDRYLSDDERERLLAACKASPCELLYPVVVFALSTGARKGEILNLTWADIDWEHGLAVFRDTKNDEVRSVPIEGHLLAELQKLSKVRRIDTNLVFPRKDGRAHIELRKPWVKAVKNAKIENFRFHDLRHTAASYMLGEGVSLGQLAEILGHKTLAMVKRYAHLAVAHKKAAIVKLDQHMFGQS